MKTFKEFMYFGSEILSEELHHELQSILNRRNHPDNPLWEDPKKLTDFTKKLRSLIKSGETTGLENDKPKKGSSRAVFFPQDAKTITLDSKPTSVKNVLKIAFPGHLDRYKNKNEELLGQMQNRIEADPFTSSNYGMLRENDDGTFSTNEHGVLAPVLSRHPEHHYLEMGHISPIKKSDFKKLTKSESHPKGLDFDDVYHSLNKEYYNAHGQHYNHRISDEEHDKLIQHPWVEKLHDMMLNTDMHPGDLTVKNMGIWTHPHTGKQHPVVSDYGFSQEVPKAYADRRRRHLTNHWGI